MELIGQAILTHLQLYIKAPTNFTCSLLHLSWIIKPLVRYCIFVLRFPWVSFGLLVGFLLGSQRKGNHDDAWMNSDSSSTMVFNVIKRLFSQTQNSRFLLFKRFKQEVSLWYSASMLSPPYYPSFPLNFNC